MKREDIIQNFLYGILLSAFLVLFFILSMNSRLVADDFYFLKNFEVSGWWQSMLDSWNSWVTRWASILWLNVIFMLYKFTGNFLFYYIITLLMLCFALYRLSSFSIDAYLKQTGSRGVEMRRLSELPRHSRFTVLLVISLFFLTASVGESFYWVTSSSMYLWGLIAMCFLLAELIRAELTVSSVVVTVLTAAFAGGAAESISIPLDVILLSILIFQAGRKKIKPLPVISFVVLTGAICMTYFGDGRAARQASLPAPDFLNAILTTFKSFVHIGYYFLKEKLLWSVLLFIAWMGFASRIKLHARFNGKVVSVVLGGYLILCLLFIFPACFLLQEIPPMRAWILISLLNCMVIALGGILTAAWINRPAITSVISSLGVAGVVVMTGLTAIEQKKLTGEYARAVDSRMQFLTTPALVDPEDESTIILENYPPSGMLTSSEISSDTADFKNRHLENYLGIKARLRVK